MADYFALRQPLYRNQGTLFRTPDNLVTPLIVNAVHIAVGLVILASVIFYIILLNAAIQSPAQPTFNYESQQGTRKPFAAMEGFDASAPMVKFQVATANFAGVFTEDSHLLNPWNGRVSTEAMRQQVEAGARAAIVDIWPDPLDLSSPVVCLNADLQTNFAQKFWFDTGLNKGVGRFSSWKHITRNKVPAGEILTTAVSSAFTGKMNQQTADPFFLILKLHGAMSVPYLNRLGDIVNKALGNTPDSTLNGGHAMNSAYSACKNQTKIASAPISDFQNRVCVIVIPDIQPTFNSLPGVNTFGGFIPIFLTTTMGEATNFVEQVPNTVSFEPVGISTLSLINQPNAANPTGPLQTLPQNGFCIVQPLPVPSWTGTVIGNDAMFSRSYVDCLQSGAQFVGMNYFPPNKNDGALSTHRSEKYFKTFSFRKIA